MKRPNMDPKTGPTWPQLGLPKRFHIDFKMCRSWNKKKEEEKRWGQKSEKGKYTLYELLGGKRREVNLPSYNQLTTIINLLV